MNDKQKMADNRTILRALVGSTAHGINVDDGQDDRDEMGICIEELRYAIGFEEFQQWIYRSAAEREGNHDAKSKAGDLDLVVYSLRKYLRLALKGNPTILILLFSPAVQCVIRTPLGEELQKLAPLIISRKCAGPFLGYLTAQKQRLLGIRGQKRIHRPDLVKKYGFDTKYATHMLRLGIQGVELLESGRMTLPMREDHRDFLKDVRLGKVSQNDCLTKAGELEKQLEDLKTSSPLQDVPHTGLIESWMTRTYFDYWSLDRRGT